MRIAGVVWVVLTNALGSGFRASLPHTAAVNFRCSADMSFPSLYPPWQNLNGVMVAVAELLRMKIPNSYEVLFPESPARVGIEPKKGEAEGPGEWDNNLPWD